jgi:hypothetical protein
VESTPFDAVVDEDDEPQTVDADGHKRNRGHVDVRRSRERLYRGLWDSMHLSGIKVLKGPDCRVGADEA